MRMEAIFIAIEALLLVLFYPFRIEIKAHAVLQTGKMQVDIGILRLRFIRVRVNVFKDVITINGKARDLSAKTKINVSLALRYVLQENLLKKESTCLVYSTCDAKINAILWALTSLFPFISKVYALQNNSNACFDGDAVLRINAVQMVGLVFKAVNG